LDTTPAGDFVRITTLAREHLEQVQLVEEDYSPERAILRLTARYRHHRVFITEIVSRTSRQYRYYVLDKDVVVVGFDNAADARALHLKYGQKRKKHIGELIPHVHLKNKAQLELTEEMTCAAFLAWLQANVPTMR
jgi:hypothetical protein